MGNFVESLKSKLSLTRRGFMKGTVAAGAAALYGCSKGDDADIIYQVSPSGSDVNGGG